MWSRSSALIMRVRNDRMKEGFSSYLPVFAKVGAAIAIIKIARNVIRRISPPITSGAVEMRGRPRLRCTGDSRILWRANKR